ncbi:MAG: alpha-L-fucosidase, partial [Oscillospiraceae bacterium]
HDCPFHTNKNADICKNLFEAFRRKGLGISAYFSKADWHIPSYWAPDKARANFTWRGPSYNPVEEPELWEEFVQFTQNQVKELCTEYGKIDMLWFDAGWVCAQAAVKQDIRLGEMIEEIRKYQPWVLSADRTIGGEYENIITPEQCIPEEPLNVPWESCITMGTSFSFKYEDDYKTSRQIINILIDIVAKGGNLALNVGPQPDGRIPAGAIKAMKGIGEWLKTYGEAVYSTRVCAPYKKENIAFTKNGDYVYAIVLYPDENQPVEKTILIPYTQSVKAVTIMGTDMAIPFEVKNNGIQVVLPDELLGETPIAHIFKII